MKLVMVRHGESVDNVNGITQGQRPGMLTGRGVEQAKRLGARLKDEKIDVIFSSDSKRAVDTTAEIVKYHESVPVYYTPEIRERAQGIFEGRPKTEIKKADVESGLPFGEFKPEGGESFRELMQRAAMFLEKLKADYMKETILISSHRWFIQVLLGILLKKTLEESVGMNLENTSVNIVEIIDGVISFHLLNSTDHL